ncbi:MAG: hypothetical protein Q9159_005505 [Coniocarpon cinnabarinum]
MATGFSQEGYNALQGQLDGAVVLIAFATFFVTLRVLASFLGPSRPVLIDWNLGLILIAFAIFTLLCSFVIDMIMLVLPIPILWRTQMGVPKKLGLIATFAVGSAGMIGACIRLAYYVRQQYAKQQIKGTTKAIALDMVVTYIECGMYLIAACLPSLRIVCVQLQKIISSSVNSLWHRRRASRSSNDSGGEGSDGFSDKMPADKVFVKLTGIGKLDTLAREGQKIGHSRMESGLWSARRTRVFEADIDESDSVDAPCWGTDYVCHVCHKARGQRSQRGPRVPPKPANPVWTRRPIIE